jgi:hypothetical protein
MANVEALALRVLVDKVQESRSANLIHFICRGMSHWGSRKGKIVQRALLRIGWQPKLSKGSSHIQLYRGLRPEDL